MDPTHLYPTCTRIHCSRLNDVTSSFLSFLFLFSFLSFFLPFFLPTFFLSFFFPTLTTQPAFPNPETNWVNFVAAVRAAQAQCPLTFCPVKKAPSPWVDLEVGISCHIDISSYCRYFAILFSLFDVSIIHYTVLPCPHIFPSISSSSLHFCSYFFALIFLRIHRHYQNTFLTRCAR